MPEGDPDWWRVGVNNSVADVALGFSNMFRVGSGLGTAIYCEDLPDYRRMELIADDIVRGGSIFLTVAGPVGGRFGGKPSIDKFSRQPKSLMDEMVMDAAKNGAGKKLPIDLIDPRYRGMDKMSYGETSAAGVRSEVHYVRDPATGRTFDFKFKHHAERYR